MKGQRISYSADELAWIERHKTYLRADAHALFVALFHRPDVSLSNYHSLCKRKGWHTGRTGQFSKGQPSHNKGQKGVCSPGSEKGWFKKGGRTGRANDLYKPIGTERLSKDGYLERKIHDGMPLQSRWRAVHLVEWEAVNGPIPAGHALKCLDGDKTNTDPSNWDLIPRALLPRLNGRFGRGYDQAEPEMKPTILLVAKLEHAAREVK
jgi:hypothetical protein